MIVVVIVGMNVVVVMRRRSGAHVAGHGLFRINFRKELSSAVDAVTVRDVVMHGNQRDRVFHVTEARRVCAGGEACKGEGGGAPTQQRRPLHQKIGDLLLRGGFGKKNKLA